MAQGPSIKFVPPSKPTPGQVRLHAMKESFANLPQKEQDELKYVKERIDFLRSKYGSSADLAIAYIAIEISVERGQ